MLEIIARRAEDSTWLAYCPNTSFIVWDCTTREEAVSSIKDKMFESTPPDQYQQSFGWNQFARNTAGRQPKYEPGLIPL